MSDDVTDESPETAWGEIADEVHQRDEERSRCCRIVRDEIEAGSRRGVPMTSAIMRILHRIAFAIENG